MGGDFLSFQCLRHIETSHIHEHLVLSVGAILVGGASAVWLTRSSSGPSVSSVTTGSDAVACRNSAHLSISGNRVGGRGLAVTAPEGTTSGASGVVVGWGGTKALLALVVTD